MRRLSCGVFGLFCCPGPFAGVTKCLMRDGQEVTTTRLDFDCRVRAVQGEEVLDLISGMPVTGSPKDLT